MPLAVLETPIQTSERPQAHALDRAATGVGQLRSPVFLNLCETAGR